MVNRRPRGLEQFTILNMLGRDRGRLGGMRGRTTRSSTSMQDAEMMARNERIRSGKGSALSVGAVPSSGAVGGPHNFGRAVEFSRGIAGLGGGGIGGDAIASSGVLDRLAQEGIYRDDSGTWQIRGMERGPSLEKTIRDAAVRAMDPSGKWSGLVASTENLGLGTGVPSGTQRGTSSGNPPFIPQGTTPAVPTSPTSGTTRPGQAVPPVGGMPGNAPGGTQAPPARVPPGPVQQISGIGGQQAPAQTTPAGPAQQIAGIGYMDPNHPSLRGGGNGQAVPPGQQHLPGATRDADWYASQIRQADQQIGGQPKPYNPTMPPGQPHYFGQQAPGGPAQQLAGIGGQTQGRVGPTGRVHPPPGFGTPGQTQVPVHPAMAGMQQQGGLAGLGQRIASTVQSRLGITLPIARPGQVPGQVPGLPGLSGLGDRIRASVQGGLPSASRPGGVIPQQPVQPGGPGSVAPVPGGTTPAPAPPGGPVPPTPGGTTPANPSLPPGSGTLGSPGGDYANVDQANGLFEQAASEFGVPADVLKAMAMIESGGAGLGTGCRPDEGYGDGPSCGMMQVKPEIWQDTVPGCGYDAIVSDPSCNVRTAAAILKQGMDQCGGDWRCAITTVYFPGADPNGTGQADYLAAMDRHLAAINGAAPAPAPAPGPGTGGQPVPGTTAGPGTAGQPGTYPAPGGPGTGGQPGTYPGTTPAGSGPGTGGQPGESAGDPLAPSGPGVPPRQTGVYTPVATPEGGQSEQGFIYGDGLGIHAGPDADESWVQTMFPGGEGSVTGTYKNHVCGPQYGNYECCSGNGRDGCWYNSSVDLLAGATNQVHPGYDIGAANGSTFAAPMSGEIIGTKTNASDPRCQTPNGVNECTWAYDYGVVMDGGLDSQGNQIYINYDHADPGWGTDGLVGQYVEAGTPIGGVCCASHIHVEAHGWCPALGKSVVLDPTLVYNGYYQQPGASTCDGVV